MSSYLDSPSAPEPPGFVEQRLFLRKKVETPMPIELLPGKEVWLYDLGEGGLSVSGSSRLEPGTATFLDFQFPDLNSVIEAAGVVAWCDNSGRVGVRFTRIKPDSTAVLKRWLKSDQQFSPEQTAETAVRVPELSGLVSRAHFEISDLRTQLAQDLDTNAAMKLIAERMAYHTRATGAAIAWRDGDDVVCRASHGNAPEVGVRLNLEGSLSGECYRTGNIVSLADSEHDMRVDAELCRQLDFRSLLIVPVMSQEDEVVGIAEVFSSTPGNFEGGDVLLLSSIAELIGDLYDRTQPPAHSGTHHADAEGLTSANEQVSSSSPETRAPAPFVPTGFELADTKSEERGTEATEQGSSGQVEHSFEDQDDDPSSPGSKSRRVLLGALLLAGAIGAGDYLNSRFLHVRVAAHPPTESGVQPVVVPIASLSESQPQAVSSPQASVMPAGFAEAASVPNRNAGKRLLLREESVESNFAAGLAGHLHRAEPSPEAPSLIASDHSAFRVDTTYFLPARAPQVKLLNASLASSQVTAGRLLHRVNPVFPQFARTAGLHGAVVIAATIGTDGRLKNMKLISGNGALAIEAFRAARQWVYAPYRLNGQPIEVDARIVMDFDRP